MYLLDVQSIEPFLELRVNICHISDFLAFAPQYLIVILVTQ